MILKASNGQCYSHNITQVARHMRKPYAMFTHCTNSGLGYR